MTSVSLLHAKLHRVRITECRPDYVGSLGIDSRWMQKVGLLPLQEIHCWNVTRGSRFVTYAIPAKPGSKEISPNGACAHLCAEGDLLIIAAFQQRAADEVRRRGHRALVLIFGDDGEPSEYLEQLLTIQGEQFEFVSSAGAMGLLPIASGAVQQALE
jgi:aspartate 1-decarboxylase